MGYFFYASTKLTMGVCRLLSHYIPSGLHTQLILELDKEWEDSLAERALEYQLARVSDNKNWRKEEDKESSIDKKGEISLPCVQIFTVFN